MKAQTVPPQRWNTGPRSPVFVGSTEGFTEESTSGRSDRCVRPFLLLLSSLLLVYPPTSCQGSARADGLSRNSSISAKIISMGNFKNRLTATKAYPRLAPSRKTRSRSKAHAQEGSAALFDRLPSTFSCLPCSFLAYPVVTLPTLHFGCLPGRNLPNLRPAVPRLPTRHFSCLPCSSLPTLEFLTYPGVSLPTLYPRTFNKAQHPPPSLPTPDS